VAPATFEDLIVSADKVLAPLNETIPPHDVWQVLVCPFCGAWLLNYIVAIYLVIAGVLGIDTPLTA
jgi:Protein of unknown function (DUF3096)